MKRYKSKHNKHWTVLIIPTYYGRATNFKISGWHIKLAVGVTIAILTISFYLLTNNLQLRSEAKHYAELKVINLKQQQEIMRLKEKEESIRKKIEAVEELDKQVRELVGLTSKNSKNNIDEGTGSMGGGIPLDSFSDEMNSSPQDTSRKDKQIPATTSGLDGYDWLEITQKIAAGFEALNPLLEKKVDKLKQLKIDVTARQHYLAAIPTKWPVKGYITSRFGYRQSPFGGGKEFHDGLDIAANKGDPILAAGNGKVVFAGSVSGYGRTVIIEHGYGYRTQYSHASSLLVKRGQTVKKGDVIAKVGSTGRSTGPHLHFMVFVNRKLVDPLDVLP